MDKDQNNNEEFSLFYYTLKYNFKNIIINKTPSTENSKNYSKLVNLKIDFYFDTIFGKRSSSNLLNYYNSHSFEVKDIEEKNNNIISETVIAFYESFNYFFDEITKSRFFYFISSSFLEKKLGFQIGDEKFNIFLATLILKNLKFENQDFTLTDHTYGNIINEFINEGIRNIRREIDENKIEIDVKEILNDINKFEILKEGDKFEFLNESINSLRVLKADIDLFKEIKKDTTINVNYETNVLVDSRQINHINNDNSKTENNSNLTEVNNFLDNRSLNIETNNLRHTDNHYINNYQTDYHNIYNSHHIENNTYSKNDSINIVNETNKMKIEINFSPNKFRDLLIKFFENIGILIDGEKKNKIDRFIFNTIKFGDNFKNFKSSASTNTIDFFDNLESILKFCALIAFLEQKDKIKKIATNKLQKILIKELNQDDSGYKISEGLRNHIGEKIKGKSINKTASQLAMFAGFKKPLEILLIINS